MPEMDGLETLRQLMQIDRTLNVIMLSCSNEVTTVVEAIRIGALDYLTKPFEKPELDAAFLKCRQKQELRSGKQGAARILRSAHRRFVVPGGQPADAENPPAGAADRAGGRAGLHQRRKRRGQGSDLADDSSSFESARAALCESELRGVARRIAGIGTFRLRARRFYRCGTRQARKIRTGEQGHDLPGRNRGDEPAPAGQAAARAARRAVLASGRPRHGERRCARAGGHERGRERGDALRPLPRRSVLPA